MIWIQNHNISGESDNLRVPLAREFNAIKPHYSDPKDSPAVVKLRGWTGINVDLDNYQDGFVNALGSQLRFATNEPADHSDYANKAKELDAYYNGSHPNL